MLVVKCLWNSISACWFRDTISKARRDALKKANGSFDAAKEFPPKWIKKPYWINLCDKFKKPEFQRLSKSGSQNRAKGSKMNHVGGSISYSSHKKRMAEETGVIPTHLDLFKRIHQKDGNYISEKSKIVGESYEEYLVNKYGNASSQIEFEAAGWLNAIGRPPKKGYVYGFGQGMHPQSIIP